MKVPRQWLLLGALRVRLLEQQSEKGARGILE